MNTKRWLSFFLAGSLLLLPVTSYYAISWNDIRKNYAKFISEGAAQKIMTVAILTLGLAAGGLYYYLTSGKKGASDFEVLGEIQGIPISQLKVYGQFSWYGGGNASCGYHTLLRGMQVVNAKARGMENDLLEPILLGTQSIEEYFNLGYPMGIWRKDVIAYRKNKVIADLLKKTLYRAFRDRLSIEDYDEKIPLLYGSIINKEIKPELVKIFEKGSEGDYEFRAEDFIRMIIKSSFTPEDKNYAETTKNVSIIRAYLDLDQVVQQLLVMQLGEIKDPKNGDWLWDNELEELWKQQEELRQQGTGIIPNDIDCGFNPIADFSLIGKKDMIEIIKDGKKVGTKIVDLDTVVPSIKEKLKKVARAQKNYFHLFGIGTMKQTGDKTGTDGHWYALVLHQKPDGARHYFVMDSMGTSRLEDGRIVELIKAIEEKVIEEREEI